MPLNPQDVRAAIAQSNVRLMIDAEHSWFQPAIDHAATELQRAFNTQTPTILNTYQCYLRVRAAGRAGYGHVSQLGSQTAGVKRMA